MSAVRQRVSITTDRKMVTLQGDVVPADATPTTLYGWIASPLVGVICVLLDDGRELLVASKDVTMVAT